MNDTSLVTSNYEQAVNVLRKVSGKVDFVIDPFIDPAEEEDEEEEEEHTAVTEKGEEAAVPSVQVSEPVQGKGFLP